MITQQKNLIEISKDISTVKAHNLIREYKQTRWVPNSERISKADSLSAWYSIEEMENFLSLAKSQGGDGVKFYYGAYPEDYTPKPEYAGRQTLVMIATKSKLTEMGAIANKDIYYSKNERLKILSGTDPRICPPICNPPSEGGMGDLGITIVDKGEKGMELI
ncbi:MAG TPA: hypothetical protein VGZ90_12175 [Puia sp.]|jgi:hypothetical protein|nr:hypothetical protein [Puia sp.]